ncbi:hypothetical protein Tco_0336566 [Tanacetum coccineum]
MMKHSSLAALQEETGWESNENTSKAQIDSSSISVSPTCFGSARFRLILSGCALCYVCLHSTDFIWFRRIWPHRITLGSDYVLPESSVAFVTLSALRSTS